MKRKIVLFALLICMIFSSAANAEVLTAEVIDVLSGISENYVFDDDTDVTWKTVTDIAAELSEYSGLGSNSVSILLQQNIISSIPDMSVTPTGGELAEVFVKILGYDAYVTDNNYYTYAQSLELFKGISVGTDEKMKGSDFRVFLKNVLSVNPIDVTIDSVNGKKLLTKSENSLLYDKYGIKKRTGIVTATKNNSLTGIGLQKDNVVAIDGIEYDVENIDVSAYLGQSVDYYTTEDKNGENVKIVYMLPGRDNNVVKISSNHVEKLDSTGYEYYIDGEAKTKKVKINDDTLYIYNGFAAGKEALSEDELLPKSGIIRAIDNDNDGTYEVLFIYDVKPVILRKADTKYNKLYFDYDITYNGISILELSEDADDYTILDQELNPISISQLQSRSVLSIGTDKNGKYIIISSLYKGMGTINTVEQNGDVIEKISVSGSSYYVNKYYERGSTDIIKTGVAGTFYYDFNLEIVAFVKENNSENIGYLVRAYIDEEDSDMPAIVKIFNISGVFEILELADKVTLYSSDNMDGIKTTKEACISLLDTQSLIAYNTVNNKVTKIYATVTDEDMKYTAADYPVLLNKTVENDGKKLTDSRLYQGIMGGVYRLPKSTVIFSIPVDKDKEDKYSVYYGSAFPSNGDKYFTNTVKFYNIDEYLKINIMVEEKQNTAASVSNNADVYVLDGTEEFLTEDDEGALKLICYGEDGAAELYTKDYELTCASDVWGKDKKVTDLKKGDLIQVSANEDGELMGFRVLFEAKNPGEYFLKDDEGSNIAINSMIDFAVYFGRVDGVDDNAIIQNCIGTGTERKNNIAQLTDNINNYPTSFFQYDATANKVSVIELSDIEVGDEVFIKKTYTSVNTVYKIIR